MVCQEVGHVVVQPFKHVQGIVDEEDCVIIAIQQPLEVVVAMQMCRQEGGHPSPVNVTPTSHTQLNTMIMQNSYSNCKLVRIRSWLDARLVHTAA